MKPTISVQHADKQDKDIFTAGNVVINEDKDIIIMVLEVDSSYGSFMGLVLEHYSGRENYIDRGWSVESFKQFHGTITINV